MALRELSFFVLCLSALVSTAHSQDIESLDTGIPKPRQKIEISNLKPSTDDNQRDLSLPYPYTKLEQTVDNGIYYNEPEMQVTNIVKVQLLRGPNGEKLDNPIFYPKFHKDSEINYFRLDLPTFNTNRSRIDQATEYCKQFMNVNGKKENILLSYAKINGKKVLNRMKVSYFNQITRITKDYYLDLNFLPEQIDFKKDLRKAHEIFGTFQQLANYDDNLNVQQNTDCNQIRTQLGGPKFFTCDPYVNKAGFHPPDMYTVDVVLDGVMKKKVLFHVVQFSEDDAFPFQPDNVNPPTTSNKTLFDYLLEYMRKYPNKNKGIQHYMLESLSSKEFIKQISKFDAIIDEFVNVYDSEKNEIDKVQQMKLKSLLWDRKKQSMMADDTFMDNVEMMDSIAQQITVYGINRAKRKVKHDIKNRGDIQTYMLLRKRHVNDYHVGKIYEYLDYLRFLKDKKIEQRVMNGFYDDEKTYIKETILGYLKRLFIKH